MIANYILIAQSNELQLFYKVLTRNSAIADKPRNR